MTDGLMVEADLHTHTTASDGVLTPGELVQAACSLGLQAVGITDHDTTSGLAEAVWAAELGPAARTAWLARVEVVPGVELSTEWRQTEVHILGYWLEYAQDWFQAVLQNLRQGRRSRVVTMVRRLDELGYHLSLDLINELAGAGSVGRPHVARALCQAGYFTSVDEAFARLLVRGTPAYVPRTKLSPVEAVRIIRRAQGVPVLAHPGLIGDDSIIPELTTEGLLGIEAFYPEHSPEQQANYLETASRLRLAVTGGSDFHSPDMVGVGKLGTVGVSRQALCEIRRQKEALD